MKSLEIDLCLYVISPQHRNTLCVLSVSLSNIVSVQNVTNWPTLAVWKGSFGILFWYCAISPSVFDILWGLLNLMCFLCTVRSTILGTVHVTVVSDKKRDGKARKNGKKKKEIVIVEVTRKVSYIVVVVPTKCT